MLLQPDMTCSQLQQSKYMQHSACIGFQWTLLSPKQGFLLTSTIQITAEAHAWLMLATFPRHALMCFTAVILRLVLCSSAIALSNILAAGSRALPCWDVQPHCHRCILLPVPSSLSILQRPSWHVARSDPANLAACCQPHHVHLTLSFTCTCELLTLLKQSGRSWQPTRWPTIQRIQIRLLHAIGLSQIESMVCHSVCRLMDQCWAPCRLLFM